MPANALDPTALARQHHTYSGARPAPPVDNPALLHTDEQQESDPPAGSRLLFPAVTVVRFRPDGAPPGRLSEREMERGRECRKQAEAAVTRRLRCGRMPSALEGFLKLECDEQLAGWLRAQVEAAHGRGYDRFEFNLFDVELFYGEGRVTIREAWTLGRYEDAAVTLHKFLTAIPNVPPGARMPGRPRRVIVPPPPSD
jgi:hypothetical protein